MAVATQVQPPTHGRGSAAEQGARIRAQMEGQRNSTSRPTSKIVESTKVKKNNDEEEKIEKRQKQEEKRSEAEKEQKQATPAPEKTVNEKTDAGAGAAKTNRSPKQSVQAHLDAKGRCYPVSGIDNLALLMEGDPYQTTCFSTYLFKTELDSQTLHRFFKKLVEWYPKYHYVVELSAQEASKKEKARKRAEKEGKPAPEDDHSKEAQRGRRTKYSKTLKAGGWYRPARWRYADDFDVSDNIEERQVSPEEAAEGDSALYRIAGDFLGEHFDFSRPLWKALCIRGLDTSKGAKSALMIKVHHALSDGQGMIMSYHTALAALEHDAPIEEIQKQVDTRSRKGEQKHPGQRNVKPTLWGTTKHGWHTVRGLYFRRRKAFDYDQPSVRTGKRTYCHSEGIPMADIKFVRDAFSDAGLQLTLNDVACAVLSRALRMAAERTESSNVKDKRVAVFVPISKRPTGNWDLTNFTTGAIAWFAFNDPKKVPYKDQLAQVHREMNRIKRSHWPTIWYSLFGMVAKRRALFMPNYPIWKQFFDQTYREYHVATNLPGPAKPVMFGEHEAFAYHVLPPSSPGKSSLAIGMISYANDFSLAVSCDAAPKLVEKKLAQQICASFQDAAKELVQAARDESEKTKKAKEEKNQSS